MSAGYSDFLSLYHGKSPIQPFRMTLTGLSRISSIEKLKRNVET